MNTDVLLNLMELDFETLAKEHESTADNETIWADGSPDPQVADMHRANAEQHRLLARMYRRMKDDTLAFLETYYF